MNTENKKGKSQNRTHTPINCQHKSPNQNNFEIKFKIQILNLNSKKKALSF